MKIIAIADIHCALAYKQVPVYSLFMNELIYCMFKNPRF